MSKLPVLLLNLNRSKDRLERMKEKFPNEDFIRIEGIDGWQWQHESKTDKRGRPVFKDYAIANLKEKGILGASAMSIFPLVPAEVGCALSHIKAWRYIIENNISRAIIVEDDIAPTVNYIDTFEQSVNKQFPMPEDADVLFMTGPNIGKEMVVLGENNQLINGNCNYGYLITNRGAARAIEAQLPMYFPCDVQWWARAFEDFQLFINTPLLKMKRGKAYAMSKAIVTMSDDSFNSTFTKSGKKPWKVLPY